MKATEGLQNFTDTEKINKVLSLEQITVEAIKPLNETEKNQLFGIITRKLVALEGVERDKFYTKIEPHCNHISNEF